MLFWRAQRLRIPVTPAGGLTQTNGALGLAGTRSTLWCDWTMQLLPVAGVIRDVWSLRKINTWTYTDRVEILVHGGGLLESVCLHSETDIYWWSLLDDVIRMFVIWQMYEKESARIHLSDQFLSLHTLLTWKSSFICLSSKAAVTAAGALWEIILQSPWDGKRNFRSKCTHARMSVVQWGSILKFRWWSAVIYNRMCLGCSIMTKIIRIILP